MTFVYCGKRSCWFCGGGLFTIDVTSRGALVFVIGALLLALTFLGLTIATRWYGFSLLRYLYG